MTSGRGPDTGGRPLHARPAGREAGGVLADADIVVLSLSLGNEAAPQRARAARDRAVMPDLGAAFHPLRARTTRMCWTEGVGRVARSVSSLGGRHDAPPPHSFQRRPSVWSDAMASRPRLLSARPSMEAHATVPAWAEATGSAQAMRNWQAPCGLGTPWGLRRLCSPRRPGLATTEAGGRASCRKSQTLRPAESSCDYGRQRSR